jgi:hypothetical protein
VSGKLLPDTVKPVPDTDAELMVTGAVPVDVSVTDFVTVVLTAMLPNAKLVELMLNFGFPAFNCRFRLSVTLPVFAAIFATCAESTQDTFAVNPALFVFAVTITVLGITTAALLLDKLTFCPPVGAGVFSVIVQGTDSEPVIDVLPQASALNISRVELFSV